MAVDPQTRKVTPVITHAQSESFKGCNDLTFASNGDLYFTDQGQTGVHDPPGRVYRLTAAGRLELLIGNGPSPNGLALDPAEKALYVAMTRTNCMWHLPLRDDDPDYPALAMGNFILGGGTLSSRLGNRVRQKEGLSYGVASGLVVSSLDRRSVLYVYAISNPANSNKVKATIREELDKLLKDGVTEDELAAAKQGYLQSLSVGRANDGNLASTLNKTSEASRTMAYHSDLEKQIKEIGRAHV